MPNKRKDSNKTQLKIQLKRGMILSLFIAFMFCMPGMNILVEAADTIIVDDDGTGDYTSIQDAINNANVGDYIIVEDGTYGDQLTVNVNALTIVAASGETPTIYVSSYSPGIDVTASDVLIDGFEIYGNVSETGGPFPTIRASTGADGLTINDNEFKVFTGEVGQIALYVASGVEEVTFASSNNVNNYEYSVFHAAWIGGTHVYYGSIQDAIDNADERDAVYVADGTYTEQITVNKNVLLSSTTGSHTSSDAVIDLGSVATYALEFDQGCDGATIKGLEVINSNGIYAGLNAGGEGNVTIQNNYIHDLFVTAALAGGFFVDALCWPPLENWTIMDNIIENITGGSSSGLRPENMKNVVIAGNTINNMGYSGILLINVDGGSISDNIVSNVDRAGIQVDSYCTRDIDVVDNIITQANAGSHSDYGGIRFYGQYTPDPHGDPPAEITVTGNTCNDSYNGLAVRNGENISGRNITANDNSFVNNSNMGVYHGGIGAFDATDNWWEDISGPYNPTSNPTGTGENVSDNVTFWPWLEFDRYSIPPVISKDIGYPQANDGYYVSDETTFKLYATDNGSGIKSLTYRIWNTTHKWSNWNNYTSAFTLQGEGRHILQVNATDNAGTSTIESEYHIVDNVDPSVEILYPNGAEYIQGTVSITWDANDKILDQGQIGQNGYYPLTEDYPGHVQSFIPTVTTLNSVQLLVHGDDANVTVKLFSEITPVPITIAQTSTHLQYVGGVDNPEWVDFAFDSDVNLDTSTTYYIGVTQKIFGSTGFYWYYFNSSLDVDPYEDGHGWLKKTDELEPHPELDWGFKTMYFDTDLEISIQYSSTGVAPWSTIAEGEYNDGRYTWDTSPYPDGLTYKVRVIALDFMGNMGFDDSDEVFVIDNTGPSVSNVVITDTQVGIAGYTKDGNNLEITATITEDPVSIVADLSGFGKGTDVTPTSYIGTTARWIVTDIACSPADGKITVIITATDGTGDVGMNMDSIIADNTDPNVTITRPGPGLYIWDSMRLLPFSYPLIIGQITIVADADDSGSGIEEVEFYIENNLEAAVNETPYDWLWDRASIGFFKIKAIAYDNVGHSAEVEMRDVFIINFDI